MDDLEDPIWGSAEAAIRAAVGEIGMLGAITVLSRIARENEQDTRTLRTRLQEYTTSRELSPELVRDIRKAVGYLSQH